MWKNKSSGFEKLHNMDAPIEKPKNRFSKKANKLLNFFKNKSKKDINVETTKLIEECVSNTPLTSTPAHCSKTLEKGDFKETKLEDNENNKNPVLNPSIKPLINEDKKDKDKVKKVNGKSTKGLKTIVNDNRQNIKEKELKNNKINDKYYEYNDKDLKNECNFRKVKAKSTKGLPVKGKRNKPQTYEPVKLDPWCDTNSIQSSSDETIEKTNTAKAFFNFRQQKISYKNLKYLSNARPVHSLKNESTTMTPMTDQEQKIIIEFCHLLEKSKQFFNELRELPFHGHTQWSLHFSRTFEVYSKLWKFQQQHRLLLDTHYGLKRWQIGEVASKIGQLYHHYYLRTSNTDYLMESFSFYSAIRGRHYYNLASKETSCELMVKKLRFYARFIGVAILLQQPVVVQELVSELDMQVVAYGDVYDPNDQAEWFKALSEVKAFLVAEPGLTVVDPTNRNRVVTISGRINSLTVPPIETTAQMYLTLQDAIIIGSGTQLIKFCELTIDMFRMVQNLEWEISVPSRNIFKGSPKERLRGDIATMCEPLKSASQFRGIIEEDESSQVNPHKFLLFKPSASQVLIYLASSCNDLPPDGALLIYISANGHLPQQNKHVEDYGYDIGGVITTSKSDVYKDYKESKGSAPKGNEPQILYPGDLHPFTRKPLFIIVDSDNSYAYQHIPRIFGQPLIILMSPMSIPSTLIERKNEGSIFTLFLHNPIAGLSNSCEVHAIDITTWQRCVQLRDSFMKEVTRLLMRIRIDPMFYAFMGDIHLRLILLRYIFCEYALRMHKNFRSRTNLPRSVPSLPEELFMQETLVMKILSMTESIGIRTYFFDPLAAGPSTAD